MIRKLEPILHAIEAARATVRRARQRADEALSAAPAAFITRSGAPVRLVQARLVNDAGARDASPSVARLSDADDVPLDSFRSDLERKKSLATVMPQRKTEEGLLDEIFGLGDDDCDDDQKDASGNCPGSPDFDPDTAGQYESTDEAERKTTRPKRLATEPNDAELTFSNEMRTASGAEPLQAKEDVNYRFGDGPQKCGNCRFFEPPAGCAKVSGLIRRIDVCDLWEAKGSRGDKAVATFKSEMQK